MTLQEIIDLANKALQHASAGDCVELEVTFTLASEPGEIFTGTYEPIPEEITRSPLEDFWLLPPLVTRSPPRRSGRYLSPPG